MGGSPLGSTWHFDQGDNDPLDCNGHGSHVAGTAAGFGVNSDGSTFTGPWDSTVPFDTMRIGPGVAPQAESSYYVGFDVAGQHIGLLPGGGPQGLTSPVAYWHVDDIEAKLAEVTAAGATIKDAANEVGGGRVVASVIDPDGNVLGLIQDKA